MKIDSRLSSVLHVLMHMADMREPATSETLAKFLNTNPVVIRRTMAGLREAKLVRSEKGYGGGWSLACDLATTTLRDVYDALGAPAFFAVGNRCDQPLCLVEQAVNASLDDALKDAEALLIARLAKVTLADLARDFQDRMKSRRDSGGHAHAI